MMKNRAKMTTIRIDIGLGDSETDEEGYSVFNAEHKERIEITRSDILGELKDYRREILRSVNNKLNELELRTNYKRKVWAQTSN